VEQALTIINLISDVVAMAAAVTTLTDTTIRRRNTKRTK
jgi:hypothetical protein